MSDSTPVAATLPEIEAAFPKLKPSTILACLRKSLPMASVASAAVEEMMNENAALRAELDTMKAAASAKAEEVDPVEPDEDDVPAEAKAELPPEEEMKAKARSGVKPVAKSRTGSGFKSATARWKSSVEARVKTGKTKAQAMIELDKDEPELRQAMLMEHN